METLKMIVCSICARGGSKGVVNKNSRLIAGKPLIQYSIEQAFQSGIFDAVAVSSDCESILKIAKGLGAYVIKRPSELATDTSPKIPAIRHCILELEKHLKHEAKIICDLDASSPLRDEKDILAALEVFQKGDYDNVITAMPSRRSPYFNLVEEIGGKVSLSKQPSSLVFRRQDVPKTYDMNASIYLWKRKVLMEIDTVITENTGLYAMPEERSIDIDSAIDFLVVESLLMKKQDQQRHNYDMSDQS
jgi:CMP-N-acetylneuraminic acid synthetase